VKNIDLIAEGVAYLDEGGQSIQEPLVRDVLLGLLSSHSSSVAKSFYEFLKVFFYPFKYEESRKGHVFEVIFGVYLKESHTSSFNSLIRAFADGDLSLPSWGEAKLPVLTWEESVKIRSNKKKRKRADEYVASRELNLANELKKDVIYLPTKNWGPDIVVCAESVFFSVNCSFQPPDPVSSIYKHNEIYCDVKQWWRSGGVEDEQKQEFLNKFSGWLHINLCFGKMSNHLPSRVEIGDKFVILRIFPDKLDVLAKHLPVAVINYLKEVLHNA